MRTGPFTADCNDQGPVDGWARQRRYLIFINTLMIALALVECCLLIGPEILGRNEGVVDMLTDRFDYQCEPAGLPAEEQTAPELVDREREERLVSCARTVLGGPAADPDAALLMLFQVRWRRIPPTWRWSSWIGSGPCVTRSPWSMIWRKPPRSTGAPVSGPQPLVVA